MFNYVEIDVAAKTKQNKTKTIILTTALGTDLYIISKHSHDTACGLKSNLRELYCGNYTSKKNMYWLYQQMSRYISYTFYKYNLFDSFVHFINTMITCVYLDMLSLEAVESWLSIR